MGTVAGAKGAARRATVAGEGGIGGQNRRRVEGEEGRVGASGRSFMFAGNLTAAR